MARWTLDGRTRAGLDTLDAGDLTEHRGRGEQPNDGPRTSSAQRSGSDPIAPSNVRLHPNHHCRSLGVRIGSSITRNLAAAKRWWHGTKPIHTDETVLSHPERIAVAEAFGPVAPGYGELAPIPGIRLPSASISSLRRAKGGVLSPPHGSRTPRGAQNLRPITGLVARL